MMRENKSWQEGWVRDKNDKVKHVVDKRVLVNMLETCRIVWEINNKLEEVQEITNVGKKNPTRKIVVVILLYVVKLYKKQIVGIVNRKEFVKQRIESESCHKETSCEGDRKNFLFLVEKWKGWKSCCGHKQNLHFETSEWGNKLVEKFFHKKCVLELDEWTFFTRNTCRDCWGRTEAHWFLVELWDFLWFIANTMKLNNSLCYSTLTMCRACCLSNQCVKDLVFQLEIWSLSQEVFSLLWCSYCEKAISLYFKQKSLDEKSFHIISKRVN